MATWAKVGQTPFSPTFETKATITSIHQLWVWKILSTRPCVGSGPRTGLVVLRPIRRAHRPYRTHWLKKLGAVFVTGHIIFEEWGTRQGGGTSIGTTRWEGERSNFRSIRRAAEIRQWWFGGSNMNTSIRMSSRRPPRKNPIYWSLESGGTWAMRTSKASTYSSTVADWWRSLSWAKGLPN